MFDVAPRLQKVMSETTEKVFGYRPMTKSFREVIRLGHEELVYRSTRHIAWSDVIGYRAFPDFYPDVVLAAIGSAKPRIALYVRDGSIITIRGDLLILADAGGDEPDQTTGRTAFAGFVGELHDRGVRKWAGPREEAVLFTTAFALFALGLAVGMAAASPYATPLHSIGTGVIVGVLIAQSAFLLAPLVARRLRKVYIAAVAEGPPRVST